MALFNPFQLGSFLAAFRRRSPRTAGMLPHSLGPAETNLLTNALRNEVDAPFGRVASALPSAYAQADACPEQLAYHAFPRPGPRTASAHSLGHTTILLFANALCIEVDHACRRNRAVADAHADAHAGQLAYHTFRRLGRGAIALLAMLPPPLPCLAAYAKGSNWPSCCRRQRLSRHGAATPRLLRAWPCPVPTPSAYACRAHAMRQRPRFRRHAS